MNLKEELEDYKKRSLSKRSKEVDDVMKHSAQLLLDKKIGELALKKGDILPEFSLSNATGDMVNIYDVLKKGPVVINFYRGAWCPYCNLELRAYNLILDDIKALGASLVSISPELPDLSLSLIEKHELQFEVLSDLDNIVAKKLGLLFKLEDDLVQVYKQFGIDLTLSQGNSNNELPLPASYVVDTNGIVILSSIDTDYTKRLEPVKVLDILRKIK